MLGGTQGRSKKVNVQVSPSVTEQDISRTHIPPQTLLRQTDTCLEEGTSEFEGLAALGDVSHPFYFIRLNHHLFLITVTWVLLAMLMGCGIKPVYLEKTTREGHVNEGKA